MDIWSVTAYKIVNGKESLVQWASGFSHFHAQKYFKQLRNTNEFSKLHMHKVES